MQLKITNWQQLKQIALAVANKNAEYGIAGMNDEFFQCLFNATEEYDYDSNVFENFCNNAMSNAYFGSFDDLIDHQVLWDTKADFIKWAMETYDEVKNYVDYAIEEFKDRGKQYTIEEIGNWLYDKVVTEMQTIDWTDKFREFCFDKSYIPYFSDNKSIFHILIFE